MSRVNLVTGAKPSARQLTRKKPVFEPFPSAYDGTCRGCGMRYRAGDKIICPGKGLGGYHPRCFKEIKASPEATTSREEMTWAIAAWQERNTKERQAAVKARRAMEAKEA